MKRMLKGCCYVPLCILISDLCFGLTYSILGTMAPPRLYQRCWRGPARIRIFMCVHVCGVQAAQKFAYKLTVKSYKNIFTDCLRFVNLCNETNCIQVPLVLIYGGSPFSLFSFSFFSKITSPEPTVGVLIPYMLSFTAETVTL
jgi:hypothetical protein